MGSNPSVDYMRNVVTPYLPLWEGVPQGILMKMRRRDGEGSKGWAVTAPDRGTYASRESGLTFTWY